ncbi:MULTISPECIES: DUF5681 domain-containing protein [Sphingomonas]|uniref:DUF5681 domain-containing protein n=1 Tax=Sphingomonas TaxID=13687 RepID=UPI0012699494|nr:MULTISPECIES: DUF5681 domain-containing protein [Sphingomonas]
MSGRFEKGRSGNPAGRPKARRPHISAFEVVLDKTFTVTQNGVDRELTVDEALQLQTYQGALKGSKMAVRAVLKMIEKREKALVKKAPSQKVQAYKFGQEQDPRNADDAMLLLGITVPDPCWTGGACEYGTRMKLATWATQAALSRPGRRQLTEKDREEVVRQTIDAEALKWPRQRGGH